MQSWHDPEVPFRVNTTIERKNIPATPVNTGTLLPQDQDGTKVSS